VANHQNLIILGAPRSGTNIFRDVLCRLPGFATWPCDEINQLWRIGNARYPDDAIPVSRLNSTVRRRIRSAFRRQAAVRGCDVLVEKTCANCLRPNYVRACFPDAKFIQIVRHPFDTVLSTLERRMARRDLRYLLKKARFVPLEELPRTTVRSLLSRSARGGMRANCQWGPVLPRDVLPTGHTTPSAYAAMQWTECVKRTDDMLDSLPSEQVCRIRYEDLARCPEEVLACVVSHFDHEVAREHVESAVVEIHDRSVGRGRESVDSDAFTVLTQHATEIMCRHGYVGDADD